MSSRPSARRATRCASQILSNSVCAMALTGPDRPPTPTTGTGREEQALAPGSRAGPTNLPRGVIAFPDIASAFGGDMKRRKFILRGAHGGKTMRYKSSIGAMALVALCMAIGPSRGLDDKYPDWSGQWKKPPNASD